MPPVGTFIFTFDEPTMLDDINLLDVDSNETATITLFDASGNIISEVVTNGAGDSQHQTIELSQTGVSRLDVTFSASGAITDIQFCRDGHPIEAAPTKFFTVDAQTDQGFHYDQSGNLTDNFDLQSSAVARGVTTTPEGDPVWVLKSNEHVYVYDRVNDSYLGSWDAIGPGWGRGIATNGDDIWIVDANTDRYSITKVVLTGPAVRIKRPVRST